MVSFPDISKLITGKTAAGIHLFITGDGRWLLRMVILEERSKIIHNKGSHTELLGVEDISKYITEDQPVVLSIDGKGVIHRKIECLSGSNPVLQIFPNADPSDFYSQSEILSGNRIILSLIRKNTVLEIINIFQSKGINIYRVILGPFALNCIWPFLENNDDEMVIENYTISLNNNIIQDLTPAAGSRSNEEYNVSGERVWQILLVPYANALAYHTGNDCNLSCSEDIAKPVRECFFYRKVSGFTLFGILGLIFLVLVINYIFFDIYNRKFQESSRQYEVSLETIRTLDSLNEELGMKESLIKENNFVASTKYSYYADRIAALVPQQIRLSNLDINPLASKPKEGKEPDLMQRLIRVSGTCRYGINLDEFIQQLYREEWISHIEILDYIQEDMNSPGEFSIQIEY